MEERKKIKYALWRRPERITRLFSDSDWQSFSTADKLEHTRSKDLLSKIQAQLVTEEQRPKARKMWRPYWPGIKAMAATFLPLLVPFMLWKLSEKDTAHLSQQQQHILPVQPQWQTSVNTSKKRIHLLLPDSSAVFLYPKSSLKYLENFAGSDRNVYLEGKALFIVEQHKSKPFNVYAGDLKTTALGTSFTINTKDKVNQTLIVLHTGKVQLQPIQSSGSFSKKILLPGQSFAFNRLTSKEIKIAEKPKEKTQKSVYQKIGDVIAFKNVRLDKVLRVLGEEYAVSIKMEAESEAKTITYTGEIDVEKEALENILQKICLLNGLAVQRDDSAGFIIHRITQNTINQ